MTNETVTAALVDALKLALAEPGEQRLFRSGKLSGLFAGRSGANVEAAECALREGLLEVVRTQSKGRTTTEWVRVTPRAVEFMRRHESPLQALRDLQAILQTNRAAVPLWLAEMRRELDMMASRLAEEAQRWTHRLDALTNQVDRALRRAEEAGAESADGALADVPWAGEALAYLDQRRAAGATGDCPLPELFAALRSRYPDLSVTAFHDRLRRLQERRALRLVAFTGPPSGIPEPEYALLEGTQLLYYATR